MINAKIVADSMSPEGVRLTTLQLRYPRFILAEFNTHRVFSRNSSSSRAIPVKKMLEQVQTDPAMPVWWGKNQPGMQAREELEYFKPHVEQAWDGHRNERILIYSPRDNAIGAWKDAAASAVKHAQELERLGVHKQIVNRILEPWQWMETIVTSTEWKNFYTLRRHPDAQPEFKALAEEMWITMKRSVPRALEYGQWHLPYVEDNSGTSVNELKKWSTARCARVSYLNHDKTEPDIDKDVGLHDQLLTSGHFSPFEHQASPAQEKETFFGNFKGWQSYRYELGF